jgi:hypothetical protein
MSTTDPAQARTSAKQYPPTGGYYYDDDGGGAWATFAAVMLGMLAVLNLIDGIAAVSTSTFFVGNAKFIVSDLHTFGWLLIVIAAIQGVVAFGVVARWKGARWVGVAIAAVNAIVQLGFMPAYPFWSLCLFALDLLVIYGLAVHGARRTEMR